MDPQRRWSFSALSLWSLLRLGDAERFPQALVFEGLLLFFHSQQAGSIEEGGGDKRLVELERASEGNGDAPLDPV